ncbi:L,D-transpeptidase catalytic domain [Modicisalibacter ilicicola DSM 19980]|uniref:L,D-transpeptidase catalytic domain n=1 Tax=Modicisalibacter ilicicola DSM 19980 TaxID=1121942 RepID=A0A1M5BS02_9GAMM|nr:L,D-transpeptidase [Halomonas ilicicola]SHF45344.1 L,D-transpeptidase catalytic domain [Halomonas ilicicola DSM 19980]
MRKLLLFLLWMLPLGGLQASSDDQDVWLLVDDETATLHVYRGEQEVERFSPVSLGRGGAKRLRFDGDRATPTGEFRINWINLDSRFNIFLGLDYPTLGHAREARDAGILSDDQFYDYLSYYRRHGAPPQDTVLGGNIGIHGLGESDPTVHRRFHWTDGCVAVTNKQIERLVDLVELGTKVIIR